MMENETDRRPTSKEFERLYENHPMYSTKHLHHNEYKHIDHCEVTVSVSDRESSEFGFKFWLRFSLQPTEVELFGNFQLWHRTQLASLNSISSDEDLAGCNTVICIQMASI